MHEVLTPLALGREQGSVEARPQDRSTLGPSRVRLTEPLQATALPRDLSRLPTTRHGDDPRSGVRLRTVDRPGRGATGVALSARQDD